MKWIATTEKHYDEMLGVLPPASMADHGFQVGEPTTHKGGRPAFASFKVEDGVFFESSDPLTFSEFAKEVKGAEFYYQ